MQSGYSASEIHQHQQQQLIDDDCSPSIFTMSNPQNHPYNQPHHHSQQLQHLQQRKQPQQQQQQHMFPQQQQQPPHCISFTHQLLHTHQQFQTLQHQLQSDKLQHHQPGLEQEETFFDVNFKLGLNENSDNKGSVMVNQDDNTFIHGNISGIRQPLVTPQTWHSQEDSAIKQLSWCNNKQCDEDKPVEIECNKNNKHRRALEQADQSKERCKNVGTKYKHFGELEAIYGLTNAKIVETSRTGNGSAPSAENSANDAGAFFLMPVSDIQCKNICEIGDSNTAVGIDNMTDNSIGEEASLEKVNEKKKRKRKMKENFSSMVELFERLVKRVMDHQEGLYRNFLEIVQRMDKERTERDEAWRRQETAKHNREALARAHEQAIASNREAHMVSCIEKITGQSINLPPRKSNALLLQPEVTKDQTEDLRAVKSDTNSRWPKAEVRALIQVRGGLDRRFLEPGLKGPLWEEVSSLMASMGYQRSAKRCKEKWENVNKYFRKSKESGKKRSPLSKTCPYFDQLNQLYSKTPINLPTCSSNPSLNIDMGVQNQGYSELLEAFVAERDLGIAQNTCSTGNFNIDSEMGSLRLNFDGITNDQAVEFEEGSHGNEQENHEDDKDGEEE